MPRHLTPNELHALRSALDRERVRVGVLVEASSGADQGGHFERLVVVENLQDTFAPAAKIIVPFQGVTDGPR